MKKISVFLMCAALGASAYAQVPPGSGSGSAAQGFMREQQRERGSRQPGQQQRERIPPGQGMQRGGIATADQVASMADGARVVLRGKITRNIDDDEYEFVDAANESIIVIEIDDELLSRFTLPEPDQVVTIIGEVDHDDGRVKVEVKQLMGTGGMAGGRGESFRAVSEVLRLPDDTKVTMRGYITAHIRGDKYEFKDAQSGDVILIEIDDDLFNRQPLKITDLLAVSGEVDRDGDRVEVDVKRIRKLPAMNEAGGLNPDGRNSERGGQDRGGNPNRGGSQQNRFR